MGVSENVVYPIVPNGFADHYPYEKWLFHWEYIPHFQTNPNESASDAKRLSHTAGHYAAYRELNSMGAGYHKIRLTNECRRLL